MAGLSVTDLLLAGLKRRGKAQEPTRPENPLFDRAFYAANNPFVVKGGIDLHQHYSYFGCRNGYDPNAFFDSDWYLSQNPDVAATGENPLDHYLDSGAAEGRDPSPVFSGLLYLVLYPDVRATGMNPLLHFLRHGLAEGRRPPPTCLVPAIGTMLGPAIGVEAAHGAMAAPLVDHLRNWLDKLIASRPTESGRDPGA